VGWSLYLPEEWCDDHERRRKAKIPEGVAFQTKPELARDLISQAAAWEIPRGPILADSAYGDHGDFRVALDDERLSYVVAISSGISVYEPDTKFAIPARAGATGRPTSVARADRPPCSAAELAAGLPAHAFETLAFAETIDGRSRESRFACLRVFAASEIRRRYRTPRSEWLVIEWPSSAEAPTDYWLSNLPAGTPHSELARLARLRWTIELDYRQLKGELGLDHYEGRSWAGWHHHCALVTCAHAFLTEERLDPKAQRPA
jgi:SRSO17 transposase